MIVAFESRNEATLWGTHYEVESLSFLTKHPPIEPVHILGKARYRDPSVSLLFRPLGNSRAEIVFDQPQRALTPGQVLALYEGERLIGGGTYCLSSMGRADQGLNIEVSA